jgi:5-formyltetrahydrofolate cyclo-ligase
MPRVPETPRDGDDAHATDEEHVRSKADVRRRILTIRSSLPEETRKEASTAICRRTVGLPEFARAATVMLYASFGSEVQTSDLVEHASRAGKTVCFPRVLQPRVMAAYRVADPSRDLVPGTWGIQEPRDSLREVAPEDIDLVIVPGSVFDVQGRRYGYGGGFYDTYLPRTRPGIVHVGLAFEAQIVEELICGPHDVSMHVIVTERRVLRAGESDGA